LAHYVRLLRFAEKILGDADDAEDIWQDLCVCLLENPPCDRQPGVGYLFHAMKNRCLKHLRWQHTARTLNSHPLYAEAWSRRLTDERQWRNLEYDVALAINTMRPRTRAVFLLRSDENFSRIQIAERLGITVRIVEREMASANVCLRAALAQSRPGADDVGASGGGDICWRVILVSAVRHDFGPGWPANRASWIRDADHRRRAERL
jgi:RNA polymerase sigma factor (sigma-70 family)